MEQGKYKPENRLGTKALMARRNSVGLSCVHLLCAVAVEDERNEDSERSDHFVIFEVGVIVFLHQVRRFQCQNCPR